MKRFLSLVVLLLTCDPSFTQCPSGCCQGGSCSVRGVPVKPVAPVYSWYYFTDDYSQVALLLNGRQIGTWDFARGKYAEKIGPSKWSKLGAKCPCSPPVPRRKPTASTNPSADYIAGYHDGYSGGWVGPVPRVVEDDYRAGWQAGSYDRAHGTADQYP